MITNFRADLHCHSLHSDGTDSVLELLARAQECGLQGLSITDHDTTAAYPRAIKVASPVRVLPGVEFSAHHSQEPVHILGYSYKIGHKDLEALCKRHKERRLERNSVILERLRGLGFPFTYEELEQMGSSATLGRPHIALLLMKAGVVSSVRVAFDRYLGFGKPAYYPGQPVSVEETIDVIHKAHGLAILAHPHLIKKQRILKQMFEMPFDGLEGYYARFSKEREKRFIDEATARNWIITGGSDYHGSVKPESILGSSWVGQETFDRLLAHYEAHT